MKHIELYSASDEEKDRPMIDVYLPKETNGCAVVLCPSGVKWMRKRTDIPHHHFLKENAQDEMIKYKEIFGQL